MRVLVLGGHGLIDSHAARHLADRGHEMTGVTPAYLVGGMLFAPDLWADQPGPLVKPIPATAPAVVCLALLEDR